MGCDNWRHAELRRRTDERVSEAVAEMQADGEAISPWSVMKHCGVASGSVATSLDRLGIVWKTMTPREAGETLYRSDPPTPEEIRDRAVVEWVGRYEGKVIELAEATAALVEAKASRVVPDIVQRANRLRRVRYRLFCAIGGNL